MNIEIKRICSAVNQPISQVELEEKLDNLEGICDLFIDIGHPNDTIKEYSIEFLLDILDIIEANIFRDLPPSQLDKELINIGPGFEIIDSATDPHNRELCTIYKLFYFLIEYYKDNDVFLETLFDDDKFTKKLFSTLRSEDCEERAYLVKIIKCLYSYIVNRRLKIYNITVQHLCEVISNDSTICIHVDHLLQVLFYIITNWPPNGSTDFDAVKPNLIGILVSLHRLPYLFYYYIPLFSCSISVLKKDPTLIVPYTQRIAKTYRQSYSNISHFKMCNSTKRMLYLIEIDAILELMCSICCDHNDNTALNDGANCDHKITKQNYCDITSMLVRTILQIFADNLKSLNGSLVSACIKMVTNRKYAQLLGPHADLVKKTFLPLLSDDQASVHWDSITYVQQRLLKEYLDRL